MSTLDNILSLLNKWPAWKRITEAPDKVDQLEARMAELESKLQRAPGEGCPACGALEFRVAKSRPDTNRASAFLGGSIREMRCGACGFEEPRRVSAKGK